MAVIELLSGLVMPAVVLLAGLLMLFGKRDYFRAFGEGAAEGLRTAVKLLPTLVALMVAVAMLNASGAVELICGLLAHPAAAIGVPSDLLPLLLTRPFSGSASTAAYQALLERVGPDSFSGLAASVIFGSSDTAVYVIAVYFSAVGIRRTRGALPCALLIMLLCIFFSCFLCRMWFI